MWFIVWMVATGVLFSVTSSSERPTGFLFYTAKQINLESNLTKYVVGCTLNSTIVGPDVNSQYLQLTTMNKIKYETKILNETTIIHEVDLKNNTENAICGMKSYVCRMNRTIIQSVTINVGKPPPLIESSEFKCIAHERRELICEFPRKNSCGFMNAYKLSMLRSLGSANCLLNGNHTHMIYDSKFKTTENETCLYSSAHRYIAFKLNITNLFGTILPVYNISHYDIIRPAQPENLTILSLNNTNVEISWNLKILPYVDRTFEHEFLLISKYGENKSLKQVSHITDKSIKHQFGELYAFTDYELKVRVRIIPKQPRNYEDDYWSDWSEVQFQTKTYRPYHAPTTAPGAYSLKARKGNHATIEVFWQEVPQYLHNGPGFEYNVFAESSTGQILNASNKNNGMATFKQLRTDEHYWVKIYTNNVEGRSPDTSVIHIFPQNVDYQPKIKKVLQDSTYQLHWFPSYDLDNLSNYTVMYCTFSATGICRDSIEFVVLPPSETSYEIRLDRHLNFALAANYPNYSSELSWQQCSVSSQSTFSHLWFQITDQKEHSVVLRLETSCPDRSLIQRYNVSYWPTNDNAFVMNMSLESHIGVIDLNNLRPDTEYEVVVAAIDERGIVHVKKDAFRTASKDILLQIVLILIIGIGLSMAIAATISRRVKRMMDIKVDIPLGLMGIDEMPNKTIPSDEKMTKEGVELDSVANKENRDTIDEESENDPLVIENPEQAINNYVYCTSNLKPPPEKNQVRDSKKLVVVKSNDYVIPSQMKIMPSAKALSDTLSISSSGYVDMNVLIK